MGNSFLTLAKQGNVAKIKKYLDGGCDIETRNLCGFNALHYASQAGHLDVVSLLLRRGAKIDAINEFGTTAIMMAGYFDQAKVVKFLVDKGANIHIVDLGGRNLYSITTKGVSKDVVKDAINAAKDHAKSVRIRAASTQSSSASADSYTPPMSIDSQPSYERKSNKDARRQEASVSPQSRRSLNSAVSPLSIGSSTPLASIKDDGERHSSLLEIQREELVIMERLSAGGFSTVYRGEWRYTGIAIKVLRCKVDDKAYLSLQTELAVMSQLRHPRILTLMGVCRDLDMLDGTVALIMEHMERGSLHGILHDDTNIPYGPSNVLERLRYTLDIADGMRFLHKSGVVHRDLKSANVLVGNDNHAKIADFGLSSYHEQAQTLVTNVISTPAYSSPEVIRGEGAITSSADVFSFGVILWELLTGSSPWEGKTTVQIIFMSMQGTSLALPPQIRSDNPELADLMDRCFDIPTSRPRFSDVYYDVSILFSELINGKTAPIVAEGSPEHTKHEVTKSIARKVLRRLSGTTLDKDITGMGDGALAEERKRATGSKSSKEKKPSSSSSSIASSVDGKRSVTSSSSEKIRSSSVLKASPSEDKRSVSSSIIGRLRSSSVLNSSSSNDRRPISIASHKSEEAPRASSSSGVTVSVPVDGEDQDQDQTELSSPMTGLSSPITDLPSPMSVGSNLERMSVGSNLERTSSVCSIEKVTRTTADSSPMKERRGISEFKTSERESDTTPERVRLVSYLLGESLSPPEVVPDKIVRRVVKVVSEKTKNGITESALPVSDIILNRAPRPPSAGPEKYGRKVNKSILEEAERRVLGSTHSMYEMNPRKMEALDINKADSVSTEIVSDENIKASRRVSGRVLLKNGRLPGELDNRVKGSPEENADEKLTRKHSEYSMENVGWGGRWARSMNEEDDY